MSIKPIIEVEGLTKVYKLGQFNAGTLREEVEQFFTRRKRDVQEQEFWALNDVSFSVQPGEVLGIIGRNGAGKSTLLKLLSRITEPTSGQINIRGRVASLLEVGTGFHPELTGRENIYLNGAILGMSRAEIRGKFDEIVAFAEVERFLDTPVKRYSSGMYVRLAFAVAAHLEPEILIVDEVLAVGDIEFQKKCLGKMKSVSESGGRTVLFVSHNMTAVASLCSRAILMQSGRIDYEGSVKAATDRYMATGATRTDERVHIWSEADAPGDDRVRLRRVEVSAEDEHGGALIELSSAVKVSIDYVNAFAAKNLVLEIVVRDQSGGILFHSFSSEDSEFSERQPEGWLRAVCVIPGGILNEGAYSIDLHFIHGSMSDYTSAHDVATIYVTDATPREGSIYLEKFVGTIHPRLTWKVEILGAAQ